METPPSIPEEFTPCLLYTSLIVKADVGLDRLRIGVGDDIAENAKDRFADRLLALGVHESFP